MTLTEEEAKTKWCPFAMATTADIGKKDISPIVSNRIHIFNAPKGFPSNPAHDGAMCIGSACMAWRWVPQIGVQHDLRSPHGTPGQQYISGNTDRGFCGLANPPAYLGE